VRATIDGGGRNPIIGKEKHSTNNSLRDVILGGQDGLVNMLGIALFVVVGGAKKTVQAASTPLSVEVVQV
jgi:hypothetical protein